MTQQEALPPTKAKFNPLIIVAIVATVHLAISFVLFFNKITTKTIMDEGEAFHIHYYTQFAAGGHCYYPEGNRIESYGGKYPEEGYFNSVPDTYTPLSGIIYGAAIKLFGADTRLLRFISFIFGFFALFLIGLIIWNNSKNLLFSYIGAALASAMDYGWLGELGPNNLLVLFTVMGFYFITRNSNLPYTSLVASSLALSCAFLSKQTGLAFIFIQLLYLLINSPKKALVSFLIHIVLIGFIFLYFITRPDADFIYWVFLSNAQQFLIFSRIWDWLYFLFIRQWGILLAFIAVAVFFKLKENWRNLFAADIMFLGATFFVGALTSLKYGSGTSQCWPFLALLIAITFGYIAKFIEEGKITSVMCAALLLTQTAALFDEFKYKLIDKEDNERFEMMLNLLKTPNKHIYWVDRPYYSILAGANIKFVPADPCWRKGAIYPDLYNKKWLAFFESDPYDIVVLDIPQPDEFAPLYRRLSTNYQPIQQINPHSKYPDRNTLRRKKIIFVKKQATESASQQPNSK